MPFFAPRSLTAALWAAFRRGDPVALPDRVPLPNRPDGADRAFFPSVRLMFSPVRFPCLKYGLANNEGVSNVVFIDFETTERIVLPSPLT